VDTVHTRRHKTAQILVKETASAGLVKIEIERSKCAKTSILSRPGVVIGRGGQNLDQLKNEITKLLKIDPQDKKAMKIVIDEIVEVKKPDLSAR
jgi:small subunit ribosomal protein S3